MAADAALAMPPAAAPTRPRVLLVGTALAAGASFMTVMGLIGIYLSRRADVISSGATWLPDKTQIPLTPGNLAFGTMLLSAVAVTWAVDAVGKDDRKMAYLALGLTLLFGLSVVNLTVFLYKISGLSVSTTPGLLFYAVTGTHLAMMFGGMAFLVVMTIRVLAGDYRGRDREGVVSAALFWYATVAAHAVIWLAIYITK
ncbi:MAG: cytochrome c oxidase subunit 3 [Acidimicrobiales bacterium]|nr:cytochrome c oxidase subunit 3 [Acidimicrobiales bacterium]